jgi:hypothetical protein
MAAQPGLECIGLGGRLFGDAQSAGGRQTATRTEVAGCGLVRCPANRALASAIHAGEARATESQGQRRRKMTARFPKKRPSGISGGPDGLADVVPTDQGSVPSLRRIAVYARALIRATKSSHLSLSAGRIIPRRQQGRCDLICRRRWPDHDVIERSGSVHRLCRLARCLEPFSRPGDAADARSIAAARSRAPRMQTALPQPSSSPRPAAAASR